MTYGPLGNAPTDPGRTWVYYAYDDMEILLYVGITNQFDHRLKTHRRASAWYQYAVEVLYQEYSTRREACRVERQQIRDRRPPFNIASAGRRSVEEMDYWNLRGEAEYLAAQEREYQDYQQEQRDEEERQQEIEEEQDEEAQRELWREIAAEDAAADESDYMA